MEQKDNELLQNLHRLHTTTLGEQRICRNLKRPEKGDALLQYLKQQLSTASIQKRGKNWYAETGDAVITVNASAYTVITAHLKK